jgi:hypothetical protein
VIFAPSAIGSYSFGQVDRPPNEDNLDGYARAREEGGDPGRDAESVASG